MTLLGDSPTTLTKESLLKCDHAALVRLAQWEGLSHGLTDMSKRQLVKLIRWKVTRGTSKAY